MNIKNRKDILVVILLLVMMILFPDLTPGLAQDKEEDIPKEQVPVEERETGDSVIENIAELPGKIVTLPLKLFIMGVSKAAGVVDYNAIVLRVTDWLTNEDGTRKVRPIFTPGSGGGLIFIQDNLFKEGMRFRAVGAFGRRTRKHFYGELRHPQFFSPRFGLQLQGFYKRFPDEDFFGFGNNSVRINETNYLHQESNFQIELLSNPFEKVVFSAGFTYSNVDIMDGRDSRTPSTLAEFTPDEVPGLFGAEMGTFLFRIYRDSRNRTGNPTKGAEEYFSYEYSRELGGSELGYSKFTIDLQRYIHLFYNRVLALRVRTEITDNIGNREIPFYRVGALGGRDIFRGHRRSRFRDKDVMVLGAEYRFPILGIVDALAFVEEGRVFSDVFDEFSLRGFKYGFGGGLRIRSREGNLVALLEIGKSKEQLRFYFELNKGLREF